MFLWNMQFEYQLLLDPRFKKLPPPSCSDFDLVYGENKVGIFYGHGQPLNFGVPFTTYIYFNEKISCTHHIIMLHTSNTLYVCCWKSTKFGSASVSPSSASSITFQHQLLVCIHYSRQVGHIKLASYL